MKEYRLRVVFKDYNFQDTNLHADTLEQAENIANGLLVIGDTVKSASIFFAEGKNRWNYTSRFVKLIYNAELERIKKLYN